MKGQELVAILIGDPPDLDGLSFCTVNEYQVVFSARKARFLTQATRKSALKAIVQHTRDLEQLMPFGTVLPVLPGTRLAMEDADAFVAANAPLLEGLSTRFKGFVQYQVTVHWPVGDASSKFGWKSAAAIAKGTAELMAWVRDRLAEVVDEQIELPREPDMLWNAAVLLNPEAEAGLTEALERVDELWPEGFRIRMVGPSPAVSFGSIGLRHIKPSAVHLARSELGVSSGVGLVDLAAARRTALMAAGSESRQRILDSALLLDAACRADRDSFAMAFTWREGQSAVSDDRRQVA